MDDVDVWPSKGWAHAGNASSRGCELRPLLGAQDARPAPKLGGRQNIGPGSLPRLACERDVAHMRMSGQAATSTPVGGEDVRWRPAMSSVVRGECLIDGWLPGAIVARCVRSCRDERGAEVVAGLIEAGLRERDGAGKCQLLDLLAHSGRAPWCRPTRKVSGRPGSKGGRTNPKTTGRAREAQT